MLPEIKDPVRIRAQRAAEQRLTENPHAPMQALDAYLEIMIGGRMDEKYPMQGANTSVTIERGVGLAPFSARIYRGTAQHEQPRAVPIGLLAERLNQQPNFRSAAQLLAGPAMSYRSMEFQGAAQGVPYVGASLAGLVERVNDKEFPGDAARRISYQGAVLDVEKARQVVLAQAGLIER